MNTQRETAELDQAAESMIASMRQADCNPTQCVDCGQPVAPRSCYCQACEDAIYAE